MKRMIGGVFSIGALLGIICLVLVGCGGSSSSDSTPASSVTAVDCATVTPTTTVQATGQYTFSPDAVTIPTDGVVKWESTSALNHTVTSGIVTGGTPTTATPDGKFDQPLSGIGSTVCLKFTQAGTYNYYCTPHYSQGMIGVVTVQ